MEYAPEARKLRCPYCRTEQPIVPAPRPVAEHDYGELRALPVRPPVGTAFACPSCQARTESDLLSVRCQFCATPLVADADATERVAPEAVVPFKLAQPEAREALKKWTSSRWFAPGSLKKVTEAETFAGSYLPFWTFDSDTTSDYTGQRGEHYYVTETYTENGQTKTRQVQRTRWHHASGVVGRHFDDLLVNGCTLVTPGKMEKLEPWPLKMSVPYQREYLAGFQTVRYDVEPESGFDTAKHEMAEVIERDVRDDIGGDEQRVHQISTRYDDVTYKLMLLPVWFLSYLHGGKTWQVMVNAHTGEVIGNRPYSAIKITLTVLAILAIIIAIVVAVRYGH
jgi:hypothetical protein